MGVIRAYELAEQSTTSTGTGNITLSGLVTGRQALSAVVTVNDCFTYRISADDGTYFEVGTGRLLSGGVVERISARHSSYDPGTASWTVGDYAMNLPAGPKKVAVVMGGAEAPVSTFVSRLESPRINIDAGANHALAWGRMAIVNGGTGSLSIGNFSESSNGGAAVGSSARAFGSRSLAGPSGETAATARGAVALDGAVAHEGHCVVVAAFPDRTASTSKKSQGGTLTRGVQTNGTTPGVMRMFCETTDAGFYYHLDLFGHRDNSSLGVDAGAYAARIRVIVVGNSSGAPAVIHSGVTDELRVGTGATIAAPVIAVGSAQDWTVTVTGNAGEIWTWTLTGAIAAGTSAS